MWYKMSGDERERLQSEIVDEIILVLLWRVAFKVV